MKRSGWEEVGPLCYRHLLITFIPMKKNYHSLTNARKTNRKIIHLNEAFGLLVLLSCAVTGYTPATYLRHHL